MRHLEDLDRLFPLKINRGFIYYGFPLDSIWICFEEVLGSELRTNSMSRGRKENMAEQGVQPPFMVKECHRWQVFPEEGIN